MKKDNVTDLFLKTPPASQESEMGVLGSVLLDNTALDAAAELIEGSDFYREGHRLVFDTMQNMSERGEPIDILTLVEELRKTDKLERCGGAAYVAGLADTVPSAAHVASYAKIVREKSVLRALIATTQQIAARAYEDVGEIDDFLDEAESAIFDVADRKVKTGFIPLKNIVKESFKTLERLSEHRGLLTGVSTGFVDFDEITAGLQPGDLIVIAGRPGMGKTALALNIARNAAVDTGVPTAFYSLEMAREQLAIRMFCTESKIDSKDMRRGFISKNDWAKLMQAANTLQAAPIFIDDSSTMTVLEMKAKARRMKARHNIGLIVIDYMQLMKGRQTREGNREQEIADVSRSLKALAKELRVPVVALSQLNRAVESREDKRPRLADLRESGAIEQDADVIAFLYRDKMYNDRTDDECMTELIIGKQRNGPVGVVKLAFREQFTRFESYSPIDDIRDPGEHPARDWSSQ